MRSSSLRTALLVVSARGGFLRVSFQLLSETSLLFPRLCWGYCWMWHVEKCSIHEYEILESLQINSFPLALNSAYLHQRLKPKSSSQGCLGDWGWSYFAHFVLFLSLDQALAKDREEFRKKSRNFAPKLWIQGFPKHGCGTKDRRVLIWGYRPWEGDTRRPWGHTG